MGALNAPVSAVAPVLAPWLPVLELLLLRFHEASSGPFVSLIGVTPRGHTSVLARQLRNGKYNTGSSVLSWTPRIAGFAWNPMASTVDGATPLGGFFVDRKKLEHVLRVVD